MAGALCSFEISEIGRLRMATILCFLNIFQVVLAIAIIMQGVVLYIKIESQVHLLGDVSAASLSTLLFSFGVILLVTHSIGAKMCYDLGFISTRYRFESVIIYWIFFIFLLIWVTLAVGTVCVTHMDYLHTSFSRGMLVTMKKYRYSAATKAAIDLLQMEYKCCGSISYRDWHHIYWFSTEYVDTRKPHIKKYLTEENELLGYWAPWSCCSPNILAPCSDAFIAVKKYSALMKEVEKWINPTLHSQGCASIIMINYSNLLVTAAVTGFSTFIVEIIILLMARFLQTSVNNSYICGDPAGSAPGWLCSTVTYDLERHNPATTYEGMQYTKLEGSKMTTESCSETVSESETDQETVSVSTEPPASEPDSSTSKTDSYTETVCDSSDEESSSTAIGLSSSATKSPMPHRARFQGSFPDGTELESSVIEMESSSSGDSRAEVKINAAPEEDTTSQLVAPTVRKVVSFLRTGYSPVTAETANQQETTTAFSDVSTSGRSQTKSSKWSKIPFLEQRAPSGRRKSENTFQKKPVEGVVKKEDSNDEVETDESDDNEEEEEESEEDEEEGEVGRKQIKGKKQHEKK